MCRSRSRTTCGKRAGCATSRAEHKVTSQMGNQGTADNTLRRGVEAIRAGAIGPVREFHVWTNRPTWPQSPSVIARPKDTPPVPRTMHWEEFIGPAPMRPYHPSYHPFAWRGWCDFGTGALGDIGCHAANLAFMALRLEHPTAICAEGEAPNPETYPRLGHGPLRVPRARARCRQ